MIYLEQKIIDHKLPNIDGPMVSKKRILKKIEYMLGIKIKNAGKEENIMHDVPDSNFNGPF